MRGLLRVGFGSVVFGAAGTRDIFVRLEAFVALCGEGCPQAGRRGRLPTSCRLCDGSDLYDGSCSPNPPRCSALKERRGNGRVSA